MKIIYLSNQRLPTEKAYGRQIAAMSAAFAGASNVEMELVYPIRRNHITEDFFDYYNVPRSFGISRIWAPDFYWPGTLDTLAFAIKSVISALAVAWAALKKTGDIIYSRDELPLYFLSFFRKRLAFEAHKVQSSRSFIYHRLRKCNVRVVTISKGLRDEFVRLGFDTRNILIAPDGVDAAVIEREERNPADKEAARQALGLPTDKRIVVYTGTLFAWKGVHTLADAAALMPETRFLVVGGDSRGDERNFRVYLQKNNISNVMVTGYIQSEEKIRKYLATADVLVLPNTAKDKTSAWYTSPLKLFSYMAARRPIVASDLPSLREILNDDNAVFVSPDDSHALAEGIKKIFTDVALADRIRLAAFEVAKKHTWRQRSQNVLGFLQGIP